MIGIDVYVVWFGFDVSCKVIVEGVCVGIVFDDGSVGGSVCLVRVSACCGCRVLLGYGYDCVEIVRGLSCRGCLCRRYTVSIDNGG